MLSPLREELTAIRRQSDGSYRSLGRVKVLDFNRETGWDLTAERGDTLSGLVFNELGRYDEAVSHLKTAAGKYPRDRVVLNQLGRVLFLQRQYAPAIDASVFCRCCVLCAL